MKDRPQYQKVIKWSEEDHCYVGRCPELFTGGCHADTEEDVSAQLDLIIDDVIEDYRKEGKPLPEPMKRRARTVSALSVRQSTGLNQARFAEVIGVKVGTLRNWEQGRTKVPPMAQRFLRVLERHPENVRELAEL